METVADFFPNLTPTTYQRNKHIFLEGAKAQGMVVVKEGFVYSYRVSPEAITRIIGVEGPGTILGIEVVEDKKDYIEGARALVRCQTLTIPIGIFDQQLEENPDFREIAILQMLRQQQARIKTIERDLYGGELRLALFINDFARAMTADPLPDQKVELPMTQEQLAQTVNLKKETVCRCLATLSNVTEGAIQTARKFLVVNPPAVNRYVEVELEKIRNRRLQTT